MARAVWNDQVVAESNTCEVVDGNHYFPPDTIKREFFQDSETTSVCPWKGTAKYFSLSVGGEVNQDAAWCYPDTKPEAKHFEGYVAFWKGVTVEE